MSAREREHGELPSPIWSLSSRKVGQGLFVFWRGRFHSGASFASQWRIHQSKRPEKPHSKLRGSAKRIAERPCYEADDSACVAHSVGNLAAALRRGAKCQHGRESMANSHPPFGPCPAARLGRDCLFSGNDTSFSLPDWTSPCTNPDPQWISASSHSSRAGGVGRRRYPLWVRVCAGACPVRQGKTGVVPGKQTVPAQPCGWTGTKWGMGVRHALSPVLTFGATPQRGCQIPDAMGHASGVIGLVAGPLSDPFCGSSEF